MRPLLTLLISTSLCCASSLAAQGTNGIFDAIRDGGGWVSIPIEHGVGAFRTRAIPTAGMTLFGCLTVWPGHSGEWRIRAKDNLADDSLAVSASPGVGVPFTHTFGLQSQLDFRFQWSEPRDTTLVLWVGLRMSPERRREACTPRYGG